MQDRRAGCHEPRPEACDLRKSNIECLTTNRITLQYDGVVDTLKFEWPSGCLSSNDPRSPIMKMKAKGRQRARLAPLVGLLRALYERLVG